MKKEKNLLKITPNHPEILTDQQKQYLKGGKGSVDLGRGKDKRKRPTGG